VAATAVGHEDDLEAVPVRAVGGRAERPVESVGLGVRQVDDRGGVLRSGDLGTFYNRTASPGA
jgi:hypothetical protein